MRRSIWWILSLALVSATGALLAKGIAPPNLEKALQAQLELHRQQPTNPDIANDLGNLLLLAGQPKDAEAAYRIAVDNSTNNPTPLYNLGLLLQQQNRSNDALKAFEAVLEQDARNAWAKYQIGVVYEAIGDKTRAVKAYADAFFLDPDLAAATVNPQVIESKLTVEAMLLGFRRAAQQPLAPKSYDDPQRIANLLIASPRLSYAESGEEDEFDEMEEQENSTLAEESEDGEPQYSVSEEKEAQMRREAAKAVGDEGDEKGASRRVLTSDTIERGGSLGQVTTGRGASRGGSTRGRNARGGNARTESLTRGRSSRSGRSNTSRSANDAAGRGFRTPKATDSNSNRRTAPGRVRYVPPGRSTSSLELNWNLPAEPPPVPAG